MKPLRPVRTLILLTAVGVTLTGTVESTEARQHREQEPTAMVADFEWPEPRIAPGMASNHRFTFNAAFREALERIHEYEACRGLFAGLNLDGIRALRLTRYRSAESKSDLAHCRRGAKAVTGVGRGQTRICATFARLSRNAKATILIHEALHTAGMSESPQDPAAPTAREITLSVKSACAL